MKNIFTTFLGTALLFTLSSCARDADSVAYTPPLSITPAITRVEGLNFETGDRIGLSITRTTGLYADNKAMTYDGALFSAAGFTWYDARDVSSLTAYYPYNETRMPTQFEVAADQSSGCEPSDLLVAVKSDVAPTSSPVGMVFRHLMARVVTTITNNAGSPVTELLLGGTIRMADVECSTQSVKVSTSATPAQIVAYPKTSGAIYEAVVVPQDVAIVMTVKTADGKSRSISLDRNSLLKGKSYTVTLVVEKDQLIPTFSGEIADWEVGGALKPNNDGGGSSGDKMICQGKSYSTVTLGDRVWMSENLKHIPTTEEPAGGVWYPDGQVDMSVVAEYGMLYDIASARRLCPEGWRIPTEADFTSLITALGSSYNNFMPMAGVYVNSSSTHTKFKQFGYLMGQTPGTIDNRYTCFYITKDQTPQLVANYPGENGVSLRFVKNV